MSKKYDDFLQKLLDHLSKYKENILGVSEKGTYNYHGNINEYTHILPTDKYELNFLEEAKSNLLYWGIPERDTKISLHTGGTHLNSSQVMCINFFAPFLNSKDGCDILLKVLTSIGISGCKNCKLKEATFEKIVNEKEGTNFDFYLELDTGKKIFFEIKYKEEGFGGLTETASVYVNKWNSFYKTFLADSLLYKGNVNIDATENNYKIIDYYKNYQIQRNISYIKNKDDNVIFLTMEQNPTTKEELESVVQSNSLYDEQVFVVYWENIINIAIESTKGTKLEEHYKEFKRKYIDIKD